MDSERMGSEGKVLVLGCGAIVNELLAVIRANRLEGFEVECLPAKLHNTPSLIPGLVAERLEAARGRYRQVFVGYADCGTGGLLDRVLEEYGVERLPGSHCYEFLAGSEVFARIHDDDPRTFYLTDYLARHFDRLVWHGLGLDRWPQLLPDYFGNYRRVVYLSQFPTDELLSRAAAGAARLGLEFEHIPVGLGDLAPALLSIAPAPNRLQV